MKKIAILSVYFFGALIILYCCISKDYVAVLPVACVLASFSIGILTQTKNISKECIMCLVSISAATTSLFLFVIYYFLLESLWIEYTALLLLLLSVISGWIYFSKQINDAAESG